MATAFSPPPTTHPCYRLQGWLLGVSVALPYAGGLCPRGRLSCYAYRLHIYTHHSPGFRIHFSWCGLGAGSLAQQHNDFLDFTAKIIRADKKASIFEHLRLRVHVVDHAHRMRLLGRTKRLPALNT